MQVRIPNVSDIKSAVKIYYSKIEMDNNDIKELFGVEFSAGKLARMRQMVREKMIEEGVPYFNCRAVNTDVAFRVWGFPIEELEKRLIKLQKLNLIN